MPSATLTRPITGFPGGAPSIPLPDAGFPGGLPSNNIVPFRPPVAPAGIPAGIPEPLPAPGVPSTPRAPAPPPGTMPAPITPAPGLPTGHPRPAPINYPNPVDIGRAYNPFTNPASLINQDLKDAPPPQRILEFGNRILDKFLPPKGEPPPPSDKAPPAPLPPVNDVDFKGGVTPGALYNLKFTYTSEFYSDLLQRSFTDSLEFDAGNFVGPVNQIWTIQRENYTDYWMQWEVTDANPSGNIARIASFQTRRDRPQEFLESITGLNISRIDGGVDTPTRPVETPAIPDTIPQVLPAGIPDPVYPGEQEPEPQIPDTIPQVLPAGIPDPNIPPPEPEEPPPEEEEPSPQKAPQPTPTSPPAPIPASVPNPIPAPIVPQQIPASVPNPIPAPIVPQQIPAPSPAPHQAPVVLPGTTVPPVVLPGTTVPPVVLPGTTVPPVVLPGTTVPPVVLPGTTVPPVVLPGTTVPPVVQPGTIPAPVTTPGSQPGTAPGTQPGTQPGTTPLPSPNPYPLPVSSPGTLPAPTPNPIPPPVPSPIPGYVPNPIPNPSPNPGPQPVPLPPCPPHCVSDMVCKFEKVDICNEPCIKDMQHKLGEIDDKLDLLDAIKNLLDNLNPGSGSSEPSEPEQHYQEIEVVVADCKPDGTYTLRSERVYCHPLEIDQVRLKFQEIAALKIWQNQIHRWGERTHNIVGGEVWFKDAKGVEQKESRTPRMEIKQQDDLFSLPISNSDGLAGTPPNTYEPTVIIRNLIDPTRYYLQTVYTRLGLHKFPAEVPKSLLTYTDGEIPAYITTFAGLVDWIADQLDALCGQFPIEITIEDTDPTKEGLQTKKIELPNISEALAEIYGLSVSSSTNADISINFLMRLAAEIVATKNSSLITQDYARANAAYLGYKGNPKAREITYAFDPNNLESLDKLLNEAKGKIIGWEEDDKESVAEYLQKLMFSAGIIKAAFFRNSRDLSHFQKEIEAMLTGDKDEQDKAWEAIKQLINNPESGFNKNLNTPQSKIRDLSSGTASGSTGSTTPGTTTDSQGTTGTGGASNAS